MIDETGRGEKGYYVSTSTLIERSVTLSFIEEMERSLKRAHSNIVLALDPPADGPRRLVSGSTHILQAVHPYICAVKINRQLVLPVGLFSGVQKIVELAHELGLPAIMDCKINDVGYTNRAIAEFYYKAGFDAVISNPFVGWREGLEPVFEVAKKMRRGVILLVYMSHKGAEEGYGQTVYNAKTGKRTPQYSVFAEKALSWKADGAVVGATFPKIIGEVRQILDDRVPIYSPGVGAQGGKIGSAIKAGARYLIVGRAITRSEAPAETAKSIRDSANRYLE